MRKSHIRRGALLLALALLLSLTGAAEVLSAEEAEDAAATYGEEAPGALALSFDDQGEAAVEFPEAEPDDAEPVPNEVGEVSLFNEADGAAEGEAEADAPVVPDALQLGVKETYALRAENATFKSSKKSVATVSKTGVIEAKKKGKATITVSVGGKKLGTCKVTVLAAPGKVTLSEAKLTLSVSQTQKLKAKLPKNTASRIAWTSSKATVATVDEDGTVRAVGKGTAKITAKTFNGKKATCTVKVNTDPVEVSFAVKKLNLGLKESVTLKPIVNEGAKATFTWSTKNKKVVTVSAKGKLTGKKTGSTTITVKTQNGKKATLTVKVLKAPDKVTLSAKKAEVEAGSTCQLTAKLPSKTASQITWKSSNKKVAAVDANGLVTAVAPGKATITAKTFNGKKATCKVTVKEPEPVVPGEEYTIENGVVTGYSGPGGDLLIPDADAEGNPVLAIGEGAFKGNEAITSVVIPRGVLSVGASAFENCVNLTAVMFPNHTTYLTSIENAAFKGCKKLQSVTAY